MNLLGVSDSNLRSPQFYKLWKSYILFFIFSFLAKANLCWVPVIFEWEIQSTPTTKTLGMLEQISVKGAGVTVSGAAGRISDKFFRKLAPPKWGYLILTRRPHCKAELPRRRRLVSADTSSYTHLTFHWVLVGEYETALDEVLLAWLPQGFLGP